MCVYFVSLKFLNKFEEFLTPSLLKDTHEVWAEGFLVVTRYFFYGASRRGKVTSFRPLVDEGPVNTLPVEVTADICLEHHFNQLAVCHDEFRNQIYIPVSVVAKLIRYLFIGSKNLPGLGQVERGSWVAVVRILVQVENLLAFEGKKTW